MTDSKPEPGTALVVVKHPNTGLKKYSPELATEICVRIQLGETVRQICESDPVRMPEQRQIYYWLKQYPDFQTAYRIAREEAAHVMADREIGRASCRERV